MISDSVIMMGVRKWFVLGVIGSEKCRKLYVLSFSIIVVSMIELFVGVFMCVFGSYVCIGYIGIFIVNVRKNVMNSRICGVIVIFVFCYVVRLNECVFVYR